MEEVEAAKLIIIKLEPHESLTHAEVYYIYPDYLLCCKFQRINPEPGESLGFSDDLVFDVEANGKPYFIEFLESRERWKPSDSFIIPKEYEVGKVRFSLPLEGWYPNPGVVCDKEMKNACLHLSKEPISKNIKIADNVIFSLDKENYLHRIWLFNIETREK